MLARPALAIALLAVFFLMPPLISARAIAAEPGHATVESAAPVIPVSFAHTPTAGVLMLVLLAAGFFAMTRYDVPLPLAMSLVACSFLALQEGTGPNGRPNSENALVHGFQHYAPIAILFTAVAIPAHMIERSNGFRWFAAYLALRLARFRIKQPRLTLPLLVSLMLGLTYVAAGLMHNVTSILIMTPIIIRLCDSFGVPSRWLLCGALIASNLGGFSTRWGDTPNIVESDVWKLSAGDFVREVMPANLIVMFVLGVVVLRLTRREVARAPVVPDGLTVTVNGVKIRDLDAPIIWKKVLRDLAVDRHLLFVGLGTLSAFIVLHVIFDEYKFVIGAVAILAAILLERGDHRFATLKSLGFDVYLAFAAIFVLAECVGNSWIGDELQALIRSTAPAEQEAQPWAISLTGYLGTMFTEAASWATLASEKIHATSISHSAAWALGGGICAGSSSLVTAASAGVILAEESGRFKDAHAITFRRYLPFGLTFSAFMLIFYSAFFTLFRF